jgi:hypothetical protein
MLKQHMLYISLPLDLEITRMAISKSNNWLETSREMRGISPLRCQQEIAVAEYRVRAFYESSTKSTKTLSVMFPSSSFGVDAASKARFISAKPLYRRVTIFIKCPFSAMMSRASRYTLAYLNTPIRSTSLRAAADMGSVWTGFPIPIITTFPPGFAVYLLLV